MTGSSTTSGTTVLPQATLRVLAIGDRRGITTTLYGLLALVLVFGGPAAGVGAVHVEGVDVDAGKLEGGITARVGSLEGWDLTVTPAPSDDEVRVAIRRPDGSRERRSLPAAGATPEDRARGLAAELAYLIEEWSVAGDDGSEAEPHGGDDERKLGPRGHVLAGGRLLVGRSSVVAPGLGLCGGAWWFDEHLLLRLAFGWNTGGRDGLRLHALRPTVGVGGGAALLEHRLWLGAIMSTGVDVLVAQDRGTDTNVGFGGGLSAVAQARLLKSGRLLLEVQSGLDLRLPPARVQGESSSLRWQSPAWVSAISVGVAL